MAKRQQFSPRSLERMARTVDRVLGKGIDNPTNPFRARPSLAYVKISSSEFDDGLSQNIYTVDTYASPLANPLASDILAIHLPEIERAEDDVDPLLADTWGIVVDQLEIGGEWYLVFVTGGGGGIPDVIIGEIDENATGGGKYFSTGYRLDPDFEFDDTSDLAAEDIASAGGFSCMFCNIEETGESSHVLTEGGNLPLWIGVRCGVVTAGDPVTTMPVYAGVSLKSTTCE